MKTQASAGARTFGLLATSAAAHLIVFTSLGFIPPPSQVLAMRDVEMEVLEPEKKEEPPPPPPPEPPPPEPEPQRKAPAPKAAEPEPPPEQPAAPPPEEIADFTGETLTAEGGSSWSSAIGSGGALKGPVGKIGPRPEAPAPVAAKTGPVGPRFVPVASLARKPQPPSGLNALLERNYPRRARLQGVEGKAVVRFRVLPSGKPHSMKVVSESLAGFDFGTECMRTLREAPPWLPPLDAKGLPVETEINFSCSFEVAD